MLKIIQSNISLFFTIVISFVCLNNNFNLVSCRSYNNGLIFYDLQTFQPYLPPTVSVSRGRGLASVKFSEKGSIWSTFGKPCECRKNICGCCAGIKVKQYNFDQKMCANVTFVPPKEEAQLEVFLNEKPSSKYGISVRNPSPFCIPVMMSIPMAMCVQMSDIAIKGNNLNMCMDFIVRLATTDLFEMHFQCMQMGLDGFQYIDKDGQPVIPPSNSKNDASSDYEYYDYEADENEISNGNDEIVNNDEKENDDIANQEQYQAINSINAVNAIDNGTENEYDLQQQIQQLQNVQQYEIENDDIVTQIYDEESTTLAPIIVVEAESEPELIATITTDTKLATENENIMEQEIITTQTEATKEIEAIVTENIETTSTFAPLENENENDNDDAPSNNFNDNEEISTTVSLTTTNAIPISKPISAPIVPLESDFVGNYESATTATLNATISNIELETTTLVNEILTLNEPVSTLPTETTSMNSTTKGDDKAQIAIPTNEFSATSTQESLLTATATATTPPAMNVLDKTDDDIASTSTTPITFETPVATLSVNTLPSPSSTSYRRRRFYVK